MVVKKINEKLCFGCGLCVDVCSEDVWRFDNTKKKPYVKYPRDCVCCKFCEAWCPIGAIEVELTRGRKMPEVV
jgi:NAD-dependent dihydropyrimidine dehydrogenase PreA subunit